MLHLFQCLSQIPTPTAGELRKFDVYRIFVSIPQNSILQDPSCSIALDIAGESLTAILAESNEVRSRNSTMRSLLFYF